MPLFEIWDYIMIYAIIPLEEEEDQGNLEEVVKAIDSEAYMGHTPHIFLVSYEGASSELVKRLGFTSKGEPSRSGMVLAVGPYNGFANVDMWEWLMTRQEVPS